MAKSTRPTPDLQTEGLTLVQELDLRVAQTRGQLSNNDERVLAFLQEHADELAFHTAESLAQGAGVSAAAVVRFARRLGFASFRELRDRARGELRGDRPSPATAGDLAASPLARKARRDAASLGLLPRMLDESLAAAAEVIADARATWFLANRETYGLAVYAYRLLYQVRTDVYLVDPSFPDPLREVGSGDALIACTFRPYARQTIVLLEHARTLGAQAIVVTDRGGLDFLAPEDVVLPVPVESPTIFLSFTPAVCALESLAAQVAMLDADRTHDSLVATARFVGEQGLVVDRGPAATLASEAAGGDAEERRR